MRSLVVVVIAFAAATAACYPTLPPVLAEGTDVLPRGGVSLTVAGGGAGFAANCCTSGATSSTATVGIGGLDVRARVGVGAHQEVGGNAFIGVGASSAGGDVPFAIGGSVSYKAAPARWFAVVVDAGALDDSAASVATFGGDLAAIVAPYTAPNGGQFYVAARGSFAVPVLQGATDVTELLAIPVGLSIPTSKRVRFVVEAGPLAGFSQQATDGEPGTQNVTSLGGYGAVAFTFILR